MIMTSYNNDDMRCLHVLPVSHWINSVLKVLATWNKVLDVHVICYLISKDSNTCVRICLIKSDLVLVGSRTSLLVGYTYM